MGQPTHLGDVSCFSEEHNRQKREFFIRIHRCLCCGTGATRFDSEITRQHYEETGQCQVCYYGECPKCRSRRISNFVCQDCHTVLPHAPPSPQPALKVVP